MRLFAISLILLGGLYSHLSAGANGNLRGLVSVAGTHKPISNVIVKIQGKNISTKTDQSGYFDFAGLPTGKYYCVFIKKDYYSLVLPDVSVKAGKTTKLKVSMYPGDEKEFLFLEIGGIQVTAQRDLLPDEPETVHRITSGEIEHMQANSLADVLDMIPGNEKTGNLGLQKKQNINLRNDGYLPSAFATKIIVDDVPLSNNVNLQYGSGVNYGALVPSTVNTQYDLREVVAENIDKVEVQAGLPSVEYGDNTSGVIVVHSKSRNVPTRLKVKNNPDTKEANLIGSFMAGKTRFVYNLNYGYSERNIRIEGDEFHRIAANLRFKNTFWNNKLSLSQKIAYNRKIEEDNDANDPYKTKAYNRDHHIVYSQRYNYQWNAVTDVYLRVYVDYQRRNSWRRKLESTDLSYRTNRTTAGTTIGILSDPSYFSDVRTIGDEWALGLKFKTSRKWFWGKTLHRFLAGAEYTNEFNKGPGKQFDLLRPPGGRASVRPRSFDQIPGESQFALFFEDRLTGKWLLPFTMDLGIRLDTYNPQSFDIGNLIHGTDIFNAPQGTFINPRFGVKIKATPSAQVRFTYGKSSKIPALYSIYPDNFYLDVLDLDIITHNAESDTLPLITTYVFNRTAKNLKGYQSSKFEIGLDKKFSEAAFSLVGYYIKTNDIPMDIHFPYNYARYKYFNWPQGNEREVMEDILQSGTSYKIAHNLGWTENSGIELSVITHRIRALNMRFRVSAAFNFSKRGNKNYLDYSYYPVTYHAGEVLSSGWTVPEDMTIIPYYKQPGSWRQRTIVNYKMDYIAKPLGIWLTFKAQQVLWDQSLLIDNPVTTAQGYYRDGRNIPISAETSRLMELDRTYNPLKLQVDTSKPNNKWLFSVVVSKSVFKGAEVSLFVDNFLNELAYYKDRYGSYRARNPEMFWGIAFSSKLGIF